MLFVLKDKQALGDIATSHLQEPPMYSAIKIGGEALYKKARRGETVKRKLRPVTVMEFSTWRDDTDSQIVHFRVVRSFPIL